MSKYKKRQLKKAAKLFKKAEKREKRTAEGKEIFAQAGPKWAGVEPIFGTGKWARKRAEKALAKAKAGSRKAWKKKRRVEGWKSKGMLEAEENRKKTGYRAGGVLPSTDNSLEYTNKNQKS